MTSRANVVLAAVALGGCDIVWGLGDVTGPDAAIDGPPPLVTGAFRERYAINNESYIPVVLERVFDPSSFAIGVVLDDGSEPPVTVRDDGTFEFMRAHGEQRYRITFQVGDARSEYQLASYRLDITRLAAGRPNRTPQQLAYVQFPFAAAESGLYHAHVLTTGIFSATNTSMFGPTVTFDWRLAQPTGGSQLGLLDAREYDRAYAVEYRTDSTSVPGFVYQVMTGVSSAAVTMAAGQTATLPMPATVARNACARFYAPSATENARLRQAVPRTYTASLVDWYVFGAPAPAQLATIGSVVLAAASASAIDTEIAAPIHDPFPGWSLIAQAGSLEGFDLLLPGTTTPARFYTANRRYYTVERGPTTCTQPRVELPGTVGVPGQVAIAGTALDADGKAITLAEGDVEITWAVVAPGPVHHASANVYELAAVNSATTLTFKRAVTVIGERALFDRSVFTSGRTYMILVTSSLGRPNAAAGDWTTLAEPYENASSWSHYFVVQ